MSRTTIIMLPWGKFNRPAIDFDQVEFDWPPRTNEWQRQAALYEYLQGQVRFTGDIFADFLRIFEFIPRPMRQRIYRKAYG